LSRHMAAQDYMPHDTIASKTIDEMSRPAGGGGSSEGFGIFHPPIPLPCSGGAASAVGGCSPVPDAAASAVDGKTVGDIASYLQRKRSGNPFSQPKEPGYDTVVVARASVSGATEEMTLVAVSHPGEDINDAKKQIAEEIANTVLH
jgi:hypothetical protein